MRIRSRTVMINKIWVFRSKRLPFGAIRDSRFGLFAIEGGFAAVRRLEMGVV